MYIGRYREILGDTGTGRWEMWADMGRFAEIGEIQGDVRSCAAKESIRRLPVPCDFQGNGVGHGLAAAADRQYIASTAERAIAAL